MKKTVLSMMASMIAVIFLSSCNKSLDDPTVEGIEITKSSDLA